MKKVLCLAATTALVLSSCSENEITSKVDNKASKTPITYEVYAKGQTRAEDTTIEDLKADATGFALVAVSDAASSTFGFYEKVTWNTDKWETPTVHYWPLSQSEKLTFYAYYPDPSATYLDASTLTVNNVSISGDKDILAAKTSALTSGDAVSLAFSHVLAKVTVKFTYTAGTAQVTSIVFNGAQNGSYDLAAGTWTATRGSEGNYTFSNKTTDVNTTATTIDGSLYLMPGTYGITATVQPTDQNGNAVGSPVDVSGNIPVVGGANNVINVTAPAGAIGISVVPTVTDWNNNDLNM